jgi:hypothetical protein
MHWSGCLTLIKIAFTAIPIYVSISMGLPPWLHKSNEEDYDNVSMD